MAFHTFVTRDAVVQTGIFRGGGIGADEQNKEGGRNGGEVHDVEGLGLVDVVMVLADSGVSFVLRC